MRRSSRDAIDVVVAKLPPPDRLKKSDGERKTSYDDNGEPSDVGEESAFESFFAALGVRPKDPAEAKSALRDLIAMCVQKHMEGNDSEDEE